MLKRSRSARAIALAGIAALVLISLPQAVQAQPEGASTSQQGAAIESLHGGLAKLEKKTEGLSSKLNETRNIETFLLAPVAILVAILAAGGVLGVVYSVRDQRRVSQLHELTVTGEVSSQRRSEQSYGSFLEQSQTTLALVNDTLKLAKEATDRAAHSMDIKAQARVDAIEDSSQKLMFDVFGSADFEALVDDHSHRSRLHGIAEELRSLEGYLTLQDIKLPPYTRFIKAIDQFLLDDTESALQALRLASQERLAGDLKHFVEYWLGYMLTTVGEYAEAVGMFKHDEQDIDKDDSQYFQLERIVVETEFFLLAKSWAQDDEAKDVEGRRQPRERLEAVAPLLKRLSDLMTKVETSEDRRAKAHTLLEISRTRADIYEWVAYDPKHLDDPLEADDVTRFRELIADPDVIVDVESFVKSDDYRRLDDPELVRAWALSQARAICLAHKTRDFDVEFALAECRFKLGDPEADQAFEGAEHALHHELGEFREKRQSASLQQCMLICHSRLLKLREKDDQQRRAEARQVLQAAGDAREAVREMRQARVTIFSQIQRRNISQDDFRAEVHLIVEQDHIKQEDR